MPRTTIDIDASVLRELKRRQQTEKKSLGRLASELLAKALADGKRGEEPAPLRWTSKRLGLKVDLEDKDALWSILDGR
ncbi:MAG: antitoxin [Actinomycetota bacterium]|nr:antitoxin [Actinomycetota bacterium]